MEDYLKNIGIRIRNERKNRDWLLSQLAEKAELSVAHVSSIERGKYNFSVISLINLVNALDMDIHYLLYGEHPNLEYHPIQEILKDCNAHEADILLENAVQLKGIIRKSNP